MFILGYIGVTTSSANSITLTNTHLFLNLNVIQVEKSLGMHMYAICHAHV